MNDETKVPGIDDDDPPVLTPVVSVHLDPLVGVTLKAPRLRSSEDNPEESTVVDTFFNISERFRRFPDLPDFGILYLNIPAAASLTVEDLRLGGKHTLTGKESSKSTPAKAAKAELAAVAKLTKDLEGRLLRAIEQHRLPCKVQPRELEDFLHRGNERFLPERTFIHFNDLIVWLRDLGYIDRSDPDPLGPAFSAYERRELALAEEIEGDVRVRRSLQRRRAPKGWEALVPAVSQEDERLRLQDQLSEAVERIRSLEKLVGSLRSSQEANHLHTKERTSFFIILLALIDLSGLKNKDMVGRIQSSIHEIGAHLVRNTIAKFVEEAERARARLKDAKIDQLK